MSQLKADGDADPPCVHIISDSDDSDLAENGFAGFPSAQKRFPSEGEMVREPPAARKKLKIDGEKVELVEETAIDIDSISTNPRRTRTKVSSDTSSKFPVSSPSDSMPVTGQRKKYVKNTLPAGAFERMLNEVAQNYPAMTYQDKLNSWKCPNDLSDVEDVNNFDDQFQQREDQYKKLNSMRRSGKEQPSLSQHPNYNYQHFRTVILENLKGSPVSYTPSPDLHKKHNNNVDQPSCSKEVEVSTIASESPTPTKPEATTVIQYEKILCPSSESSATKASPSIRLHWTDEESVFRCNRLNPEIDKYPLIKMRIDYNKPLNLLAKKNEIFKTPTVPQKYSCSCDSPELGRSLESPSETKSSKEHTPEAGPVKETERKIETRRSTRSKSGDSKRSSERKRNDRRSSDKFPEVTSFQQDEFCNYLGLGLNGKVYSPTPTDNKRRSLRVKRQLQQNDTIKKQREKNGTKKEKDANDREKTKTEKDDEALKARAKEDEVSTTVNETRNSFTSPLTIKILERTMSDDLKVARPLPPLTPTQDASNKSPEIKILLQISNSSPPMATRLETKPAVTTANAATPPNRRLRRARATSNGTSTCPRSSQSDESPSKATPRRRRLHYANRPTNEASDLSESLLSDPQPHEHQSPAQNGRASTVPSSEGRKEDAFPGEQGEKAKNENLHDKIQRFLEESRKTKPSIYILESLHNNGAKVDEGTAATCAINNNNNNNVITEPPPTKGHIDKAKRWPKKVKVSRRLLRRNGALAVASNQRILRNRKVVKPLRIKISKQSLRKRIRVINREALTPKLADEGAIQEEPVEVADAADQKEEAQPKEEEKLPVTCISTVSVECGTDEPILNDAEMQTDPCGPSLPVNFITPPSSRMQNPLTKENGSVVYAYYELDILTIVQDLAVTFWKTSKLIQVLSKSDCDWMHLGECKRLLFDDEIRAPYKNRICVHNSIPIYVEMRAKELSKIRRDCNLISVYINVYYYHDEDMVAKSHSIQLDTVASLSQNVTYTTVTDSRYFVMCWSQETILGKPRSGLCKYSLTPHLDTLASIREFKCMRHEIRYLECTTDDNLIGFGDTQVTLWDHRSGDILMNYDLDFKLGKNYGSIYYPSLEVGQDNTVLIFQQTSAHELSVIAINISHNAPSHRFVCTHALPSDFEHLKSSMRTEDYVILTNFSHQELWIDCADPQYMMRIKSPKGQRRFYAHSKQNVIDIADDHLALETFSNFVLKMINAED